MSQTPAASAETPFAAQPQDINTDVTDKLILADEGIRGLVKRQPVAAVGVALLAGFIVGRIATRL